MFVMVDYAQGNTPGDVFRTNDHEHGHEWFPMIVGSNERRYAWMDEGINTYINAFSQERRYGGDVRSLAARDGQLGELPRHLGTRPWRSASMHRS